MIVIKFNFKIIIFITIFAIFILLSSFRLLNKPNKNISYAYKDIKVDEKIDDKILKVTYENGNLIDEDLSYGNELVKIIDIENNNNQDINYAIKLTDSIFNNQNIKYKISISLGDDNYTVLKDFSNLNGNTILEYNINIKSNSKEKLKIEIISNYLDGISNIKGKLIICKNITNEELFIKTINEIQENLLNRIDNLNGINTKGYYYLNINELNILNEAHINGYILIDADDISSLKYIYYVYNEYYMLNKILYSSGIKPNILDSNIVNTFNENNICYSYDTRITCSKFSNIQVTTTGGKKEFYENSLKVIKNVQDNIKLNNQGIYVIDVTNDIINDTNIRGYILINNTISNPEYYIYLTDNLFMISGYNLTKLGEYSLNSPTIRSYVESSFNLSSSSKTQVCSFSGFQVCLNKDGGAI